MNWAQVFSTISILALSAASIAQAIGLKRYADMAWELDAALTDLEARARKLEERA